MRIPSCHLRCSDATAKIYTAGSVWVLIIADTRSVAIAKHTIVTYSPAHDITAGQQRTRVSAPSR